MTSHAAVVARVWEQRVLRDAEILFAEDGKFHIVWKDSTGRRLYFLRWIHGGKIYLGEIRTVPASISGNFDRIMTWADEIRTLQVRTMQIHLPMH